MSPSSIESEGEIEFRKNPHLFMPYVYSYQFRERRPNQNDSRVVLLKIFRYDFQMTGLFCLKDLPWTPKEFISLMGQLKQCWLSYMVCVYFDHAGPINTGTIQNNKLKQFPKNQVHNISEDTLVWTAHFYRI